MAQPDPTDALIAGTKQYLSELSDDDFAALVDEVRQPEDTGKSKQQQQPIALNDHHALAAQIGAHLSGGK